MSSTASDWDFATGTGTNKISYAPTVGCSSSATMKFDVNADGTLGATEGNSITTDLDVVDSTKSVQETIEARGFVNPALY